MPATKTRPNILPERQLPRCPCSWCARPPTYAPFTGKQRRSAELATAPGQIWEGAVRSAKTIVSLMVYARWAQDQRLRGDFGLIGITQDTIRRNLIGPLEEIFGRKRVTFSRGSGSMTLLGRKVHVLSANNESDVKKIKGLTLAAWYGDELSEWPESVFNIALSRLSVPGARWGGTTNPGGPNHWLLKNQLKRARLTLDRDGFEHAYSGADALPLHRFSFRLTDNPFLPEEYIPTLMAQYVGLWRKRLIDGEWCQAEGAIWDMFDNARHVVRKLPPMIEYLCLGIDYGTTNPTSAVLIGIGEDRRLYAVREWRYDSKKTHISLSDREYSERIRAWLDQLDVVPTYVAVDPSAKSFRVQLYQDGMATRPASNEVGDGLRLISSLLATDKLRIHESCVGLIDEIPSYVWDDKASAKGLDIPVKRDDHSCDALRYAVVTPQIMWHRYIYD